MTDATIQTSEKKVALPPQIVIKDFAQLLGRPVTDVLAELMKNGIMSNLNERIDYDTARIIAEDMGFTVEEEVAAIDQTAQEAQLSELITTADASGERTPRPPVVVVMGHVDHGKTLLLDTIRKTDVAGGESGGITQHIGAYQITEKGRKISFIDTPGHEAFTAMRSRGARVADVAILVIAADDGVQPQTREAIEIIHRAGLPFVVAINKVDKPDADVERVKNQLTKENLAPEEWGGKVITVPVSAKSGEGLKDLLDTVLLVADIEPERLLANAAGPAAGTVIESRIDKGEGPVATVVIQRGTLHPGDLILVGNVGGKVKALRDHRGASVSEATPSMPVRILGLKGTPEVGDILRVIDDRRLLRDQMKLARAAAGRRDLTSAAVATRSAQEDDQEKKAPKKTRYAILLKADNLGSLEAITGVLDQFDHEELEVDVVAKGLGNVTEGDVARAHATKAAIYAFNVQAIPAALEVAKEQHITIRTYDIIYHLLEKVEEQLNTLLNPEVIRTDIGTLRILAVFRTERSQMIVGGRVAQGVLKNKVKVDIVRAGSVIGAGKIVQLQSQKHDVDSVKQGNECGLKVATTTRIQADDELHAYTEESKSREVKFSKPHRV